MAMKKLLFALAFIPAAAFATDQGLRITNGPPHAFANASVHVRITAAAQGTATHPLAFIAAGATVELKGGGKLVGPITIDGPAGVQLDFDYP